MGISTVRQQVLLSGQTAVAKKVFEAVPIQDAWDFKEIQQALQRATRSTMDFRIMQGCLNTLKKSGLVQEPKPGLFERTKLREVIKKMDPKINDVTGIKRINGEPVRESCASVDMLSELAERARILAVDLDAAADAIAEENASNAESLRKLESLRALLKNLS